MKYILTIIFFFITWIKVHTQTDTLNIKTVDITETYIPKAYKVTRFNNEIIEESDNLSDVIQKNTTVFIKDYGPSMLSSISFRGTGASHTNVSWNGIRLNSPMNGQIDFSLSPLFFYDEIELNYGASGLLNNSGALGGSVNINNTPSYNQGFKSSIKQNVGSFKTYATSFALSYSNTKWFSETKLFLRNSENNFEYVDISKKENNIKIQKNSSINQFGIQQNISKVIKSGELGASIYYFNSDRMLPPNLLVDTNFEQQLDESFRTAIYWKGLKNKFQYKIIAGYINDKLTYNNQIAKIISNSNSNTSNLNIHTKYYFLDNIQLTNDLLIRYEFANTDGFSKKHQRMYNSWIFGIKRIFKRFTFNIHNRMMWVSENKEPLSPSVGLLYTFLKNKQLNIKLNYGINYNYPTFNDLYWTPGGNPDLAPEKSQMAEAGILFSTDKHPLYEVEATSFYSYVNDWIIWSPNNSGIWTPNNLKEVENKGIELKFKAYPIMRRFKLMLTGNYGLTYSTNLKATGVSDNSVGKQLIYVPYHKFNYRIGIKYKKVSASYVYQYIGKRYISTDNNWYMPAYFLSDIQINKQFIIKKNYYFKVGVNVANLFNQNYQAIAYRPMPRRNYLLTIKFSL